MTWMTFQLTDGTTTINLVDGSNFSLVSWGPSVSYRRENVLGGQSSFVDVEETIVIDLIGANALSNLQTLSTMLDKADNKTDIVTLRVQLQNSALSDPLECVVVGRGGSGLIETPTTFNDNLLVYEIEGLEIQVIRKGAWLGDLDTPTAVAAANNPVIHTVAMSEAVSIPSPTKIELTGFSSGDKWSNDAFLIFIDENEDRFEIIDGGDLFSAGTGKSLVDDSANEAYNDDVVRLDGSALGTSSTTLSHSYSAPNVITDIETLGVFVSIRNNSSTAAWRIQAHSQGATAGLSSSTRWHHIDTQSTNPRLYNLGTLSNSVGRHANVSLTIFPIDGAGTIDINYMVIVPFGKNTRIIKLAHPSFQNNPYTLRIDPRALTARQPIVEHDFTAGIVVPAQWRGNTYIETAGANVSALMLGARSTDWVMTSITGGTIAQYGLSVERYKAYLVPQ